MAASPVIRVRMVADMMSAIERAAKKAKKTPSDIVRECVSEQLNLTRVPSIPEPGRPKNPEKVSE